MNNEFLNNHPIAKYGLIASLLSAFFANILDLKDPRMLLLILFIASFVIVTNTNWNHLKESRGGGDFFDKTLGTAAAVWFVGLIFSIPIFYVISLF
ncbi:MAG: hypothetical protein A2481_03385 [Candidatus Yonathbacteria bacterium RIFOXYC2_FULL_47_9]|nr:MAG: hypothetical protein A2481_03385 [Candidatus Yonathbacteria bacterium RIFOXYC2_FULL_47_9]HAT68343.1 hypothetical protein [Candidatus Yonathbacteria bacterium]